MEAVKFGHDCGLKDEDNRHAFTKVKALLRTVEARTPADLVRAIGYALTQVTAQDALGWFASCGYSFC
jgi:hypothetical protein